MTHVADADLGRSNAAELAWMTARELLAGYKSRSGSRRLMSSRT